MSGPGPKWPPEAWSPDIVDLDPRSTTGNPRTARLRFLALVVGALTLSVFPSISMPLGCLVWGCDEVSLGHWLKRVDPNRIRGKVCGRFYLAWGLWRATLMATAMMFAIFIGQAVSESFRERRRVASSPPELMSCGLVAASGLMLSLGVSAFAAISALRHGVRVWVGPEARWARSDETWPPHLARSRGRTTNRVKSILIGTLITVAMVGLRAALLPWWSFHQPALIGSPIIPEVFAWVPLIGIPATALHLLKWVGARIIAPTPVACWSWVSEDGPT